MFKKIYLKINDKREKIEDFIADRILKPIDESSKVDELEEKGIITAITTVNAYLTSYGVPICPDNIKVKIAKEVVKANGKANRLIQKQLKKKSKTYKKNQEE